MPTPAEHPEVLVWTDADHADIVQQVLGRMTELKILAVGSPRTGPRPVELADSFSAAAFDDLRQMIVQLPAQYLFLATTSAVKADDIAAALAQQIDVLTLEPLLDIARFPASSDVASASPSTASVHYLPQFRRCPAFLAAADPQQALGVIRSIQLTSIGRSHTASLAARLLDSLDFVLTLCGTPDTVSASWIAPAPAPGTGTGSTPDIADSLHLLTGHLAVNLRFSDQATVSLLLADRSPLHHRAAVILGSDATLLLTDHTYQLVATDDAHQPLLLDELADSHPAPRTPHDPASLIIHQWRWLLTHRISDADPQPDRRTLLAVAETILLAARTAQPESPRKLLQITGLNTSK